MSRIVLFLIVLVSCCSSLNAQLKSNFRLGIETGYIAFSGSNNLGLFLNIEPKLKSSKNTFIGLRMSLAVNSQTFENSDATQYMIEEEYDNGFFSFVPTFDHYFGKDDLRPYLGVGAGVYVVSSFVDVFHVSGQDPANKKIEVRLNKTSRIAGQRRCGIRAYEAWCRI